MTLNLEASKSHNSLITAFDGTDRKPRPSQVEALAWITKHLGSKPLVIQAPTGIGKSAIARSVQRQFGGAIVVPQNVLLDQYVATYPDVNALKGAEHYKCPGYDVPSSEVHAAKLCIDPECPYTKARNRAKEGEETIFNPMSLFFLRVGFETTIVDEAHKLPEMLEMLSSMELGKSRWLYPGTTLDRLLPWFDEMGIACERTGTAYKTSGNVKDSVKAYAQAQKFKDLSKDVKAFPGDYVIYEEEKTLKTKTDHYLIIRPTKLPDRYYNMVRKSKNVLLMSATIPRKKAAEILGTDNFHYLDLASPIPKEQRPILFRPKGLTAKSTAAEVAAWIKTQRKEFAGNTIVHLTYSMAKAVHQYFPDALIHKADTKAETLAKFKRQGGLWLAGGCAEGIDLPGDEARLNLIPILPYSNLGDPVVKARMALPGGSSDYALNMLITTIQQVGRTTRGESDHSTTIIGDNRLAENVGRLKSELPKSFVEAVNWKGI